MIHLRVIILIKTVYRIPLLSEKLWMYFALDMKVSFRHMKMGFLEEQTKENSSSHVCIQFGRKLNTVTLSH